MVRRTFDGSRGDFVRLSERLRELTALSRVTRAVNRDGRQRITQGPRFQCSYGTSEDAGCEKTEQEGRRQHRDRAKVVTGYLDFLERIQIARRAQEAKHLGTGRV